MSQDETAEDVQRRLNLESEEQVRELRRRNTEQMRKEAADIDAVYVQRELEQRNQGRRDGSMSMGDFESSAFRTSAAAHFAPQDNLGKHQPLHHLRTDRQLLVNRRPSLALKRSKSCSYRLLSSRTSCIKWLQAKTRPRLLNRLCQPDQKCIRMPMV